MTCFSLNPGLDPARLAREYARHRRISIEPLLAPDGAALLHDLLRQRTDWRQVVIAEHERVFEFDRETQKSLTAEQRAALDNAIYARARRDFQMRYETIRVPDDRASRLASDDPLFAFAEWLSSGEVREFFRQVTGERGIEFADCQATAYSPGDFLTSHDDGVEGKNRHAAYVLGLNPEWRWEWGGLFLMHGREGRSADALMPGFNRLNLFAVPQMHSVTEVTRASPFRRYSITGWMRAGPRLGEAGGASACRAEAPA